MRRNGPLFLLVGLAVSACSLVAPMPEIEIPQTAAPLSWAAVSALPPPGRGQRISYGDAPAQFGVLRTPDGPGPHPVVVLLHGGCWLAQFDMGYFEHWADWLRQEGYATWNLEYRRLGEDGGGWPNTFLDIAEGIDMLRGLAPLHRLDLERLTVAGHSAGGHLALWAASRHTLAADSDLYREGPLPVHRVVGLAAITDLARYREGPPGSCHASVEQLLQGTPNQVPRRYQDGSPQQRIPTGSRLRLIHGDADAIVDVDMARDFVAAAAAGGDDARVLILPGAGHFDVGVPTAASIVAMRQALRAR